MTAPMSIIYIPKEAFETTKTKLSTIQIEPKTVEELLQIVIFNQLIMIFLIILFGLTIAIAWLFRKRKR